MLKRIGFQILFIAFATALSGEIRIAPFGWEFRFGLGSSTFFLLLLLVRQVPYIRTGIVTGIVVVLFRSLTSPVFLANPTAFFEVSLVHFSAMIYYCTFAIGMSRIKEKRFNENLFYLGIIVVLIDSASNLAEIFTRFLILHVTPISLTELLMILLVAIIRVFFVIGLYANIILIQLKVLHKEQEKRLDQLLVFGSNLYSESFYLSKMMDTIETITASSFELYRQLDDDKLSAYSGKSLAITEQIHEVKKDAQRIVAGLTKLYDTETVTEMNIKEILNFVKRGNQQYSAWLEKEIKLSIEQHIDYTTIHFFPLITVLNNIVANAVEAIHKKGSIHIQVYEENTNTYFLITDTGGGVKNRDLPYLFASGFTTKFNEKGIASTGIGLSHVRNIVELFGGEIKVQSDFEVGTKFCVYIPTNRLAKGRRTNA